MRSSSGDVFYDQVIKVIFNANLESYQYDTYLVKSGAIRVMLYLSEFRTLYFIRN